jgi:hypothetical protein
VLLTVGYILTVREVNWVKVPQGQSRGQCEEPEDDKVCSLRVSGDSTDLLLGRVPMAAEADCCCFCLNCISFKGEPSCVVRRRGMERLAPSHRSAYNMN